MKSTLEVTGETVRLPVKIPNDAEMRVESGTDVKKGDVLAVKANAEVQYKLAHSLQVKSEMVPSLLKKQVGEQVNVGEVLAERRGLWQVRKVQSQVAGTVSKLIEGVLSMQVPQPEVVVASPVAGKVYSIAEDQIEIETAAEVLLGESGFGMRVWGELLWLEAGQGRGLENVRGDFQGKVVVMDASLQKGMWFKLCALEIAGLICPQLPEQFVVWQKQQHEEQMPVVVGISNVVEVEQSVVENDGEFKSKFAKELREWFNKRMGRIAVIDGDNKKIAVVG